MPGLVGFWSVASALGMAKVSGWGAGRNLLGGVGGLSCGVHISPAASNHNMVRVSLAMWYSQVSGNVPNMWLWWKKALYVRRVPPAIFTTGTHRWYRFHPLNGQFWNSWNT